AGVDGERSEDREGCAGWIAVGGRCGQAPLDLRSWIAVGRGALGGALHECEQAQIRQRGVGRGVRGEVFVEAGAALDPLVRRVLPGCQQRGGGPQAGGRVGGLAALDAEAAIAVLGALDESSGGGGV